jgi:3-oxoacyl-[acyl-carrier-protein] synthase-3
MQKARTVRRHCKIVATGSAFPDAVVTNADIIREYGHRVTDAVIQKTFGIRERRIVPRGVADTDLLGAAAERCLAKAAVAPERLSKLLVTKFIGDRVLPMTASMLQRRLRCSTAVQSFDVDGGITSCLHAMDVAASAINSGDDFVLIVSGGVNSPFMSKTDPRTAFLYGDGAAAILLGPAEERHIEASYFYSNWEYADVAVGFSMRDAFRSAVESGNYGTLKDLYRVGNWSDAHDFMVNATEVTASRMLAAAGMTIRDMDLFFMTEHGRRFSNAVVERLGIDVRKVVTVNHKYGNTMSAMLPIALDEAYGTGMMNTGYRVMIVSVGEGISGGGVIYTV